MNGFRAPLPGEKIHMACKNCGYKGMGKVPRPSIFNKGQKELGAIKPAKCPNCKENTLFPDPMVKY